MNHFVSCSLAGLAFLALTACGNGTSTEGKSAQNSEVSASSSSKPATPAADPKDPWATYANPDWDHDRSEVHKMAYGLEYIILAKGDLCSAHARNGETALVHYEGRLPDGSLFDASFDRQEPAQFKANEVITGWTRALEMMCPGDDWLIYLPSHLAYGSNPPAGSGINPGDDLIFRIVLIDIMAEEKYDPAVWNGSQFRD